MNPQNLRHQRAVFFCHHQLNSMNKIIIIFGPPGSGKGTQAARIIQKYGLNYFATGNLIREESEKETELGKKFKEILNDGRGRLVSDELVEQFIGEKLKNLDLAKGVIFDGYPRTINQANSLKNILGKIKPLVLILKVDTAAVIERILSRRICENCEKVFENPAKMGITKCDACGGKLVQRTDDNADTISKRIDIYENETAPLIDFYQKEGKIIEINGNLTIEEVWEEIQQKLESDD